MIPAGLEIFQLDLTSLGNIIMVLGIIGVSLFLFFMKKFLWSGFILMIVGMILYANEYSIILSVIIFSFGVVTLFMEKGGTK